MVEYVRQGEKTGVNRSKKGERRWKSIPPISQTRSGRSLSL
jgi:hypothetical protein